MQYRPLGRTGLNVSLICLGTMTYGKQNTEAEGHAQMDLALDRGINFFDTAEMYSVPPRPETYGRTEEVIGTWFAARKNRDKVILATKAVGPGDRFRPLGMRGTKKLKDFLIDRKIPREQRKSLPLLTSSNGDIIWVYGVRISEDYKVTPETKNILIIEGLTGPR